VNDEPQIPTSTSPTAKRRLSWLMFILAIAALSVGGFQLHDVLGQASHEIDDFIPPAFMLFFGLMLLAAARAARRPSTKLTLPPDTHIHH
jgi:peptidoglycan/LPS O-acetylase OafA/YrhL